MDPFTDLAALRAAQQPWRRLTMANLAMRRPMLLGAAAALTLNASAPQSWAGGDKHGPAPIPFAEARLIVEFNSTDEDIGVQFFLDVDTWKTVRILNPRGQQIFEASTKANLLRQGGATELFVESDEPTLDELSLEEFFALFPEGTYQFTGRTPDGQRLEGKSVFTHDIPAGPQIVMPQSGDEECAQNVPMPVVIAWNDVTTSIEGKPLEIAEYEVIVGENVFDVRLEGTMVTVPSELLKPGTEYEFEILAIAEGGNQTITETCFVTEA
jgi:hypothetical protein